MIYNSSKCVFSSGLWLLIQNDAEPSTSYLLWPFAVGQFSSIMGFLSHHNVVPVDGDVGVPVGSVHLVHEAQGVEELVDHNLDSHDDENK